VVKSAGKQPHYAITATIATMQPAA